MILMKTNMGDIKIDLAEDKAPNTVANFKQYVQDKFFDGLIFHRVIDGFMIQGGAFTPDMEQKEGNAPIDNEAATGLKNTKGTIAMARTMDPHSASSQFFINVADNAFLNYTADTIDGYGYCAFGTVTEGMEVIDKIAKVETGSMMGHDDVPKDSVVIEEVSIIE